jgi:hypothetical protein
MRMEASRSRVAAHVQRLYLGRHLWPARRIALLRRADEHFGRARPDLTAAGELALTVRPCRSNASGARADSMEASALPVRGLPGHLLRAYQSLAAAPHGRIRGTCMGEKRW